MNTPSLPLWLSPIHVRVLQIKGNPEAWKIGEEIMKRGLRVQVDDIDDSLGNKIRRGWNLTGYLSSSLLERGR